MGQPPFFMHQAPICSDDFRLIRPSPPQQDRRGEPAADAYLILPSRYTTCLRTFGSYFFSSSLPVAVRVFFFVT